MIKKVLKNLEDTKNFAKEIEKNVFGFSNILIFGEVGAGKTTFTKFFLENIGVEKKIKSPSYALENFYELKNSEKFKKIWHYDIYRLENQNLESLEENFESDDFVIVEWAEKLNFKPKSGIELHFQKKSENERFVEIKFFGTNFSENEIKKIFEKFKTPIGIQEHTAQVANTAVQIAEKFLKNGKIVDKGLIYTSARLHDILKYIDFVDKMKEKDGYYFDIFGLKFSAETVNLWKKMKEQFSGLSHEKAGGKLFYEMGYKEIGKVISSHGFNSKGFSTIEEKIVYFADATTMHNKRVSVKERVKDVKKRYGDGSKKSEKVYEKMLKYNLKIEKELEKFE
ncbi:tRNA (adenosine(37)-N6)-threonylcarbamoyltransferase complex ATPase subunit type 1 TsaE [Candidatus Gracilibacteria bacterium]|nr:tRNA (adenosine(37)-N6)-threonylcarbamoyltransferase complex ATPase subunit type 1 TsaE [Candidatus Gracilibacteria bacterium]